MQYYFPSQRKLHVNGNLATWIILRAPPTSASLFWFYYRYSIEAFKGKISDDSLLMYNGNFGDTESINIQHNEHCRIRTRFKPKIFFPHSAVHHPFRWNGLPLCSCQCPDVYYGITDGKFYMQQQSKRM